ncbi:MAG: DUF302 domain-containing protein [Kangiellaceae bacterium]|jgi:uncharacterized protein (DUF302 family)|nr:DUF302 domain-containing protein [Kangiellaceae bacterium]
MTRAFYLAFITLFIITGFTAEPFKVTHSVIYQADKSFADAREAVELAIEGQGLVISYVSHAGAMFSRTAKAVGNKPELYEDAHSLFFCKADLSDKMVRADPHAISYCPYSISVYQLKGQRGKSYISYPVVPDSVKNYKAIKQLLDDIVQEAVDF